MKDAIRESLNRLKNWSNALQKTVETSIPQVEKALEGKVKLIAGCPSKEAMAELILRKVYEDIDEVKAAYDDLIKAIFEK